MYSYTSLHCPAVLQKTQGSRMLCYFVMTAYRKLPEDFYDFYEDLWGGDIDLSCPVVDSDHPSYSGVHNVAEIIQYEPGKEFRCIARNFSFSCKLSLELLKTSISEFDLKPNTDDWGHCGCLYEKLQQLRPDLFDKVDKEVNDYVDQLIEQWREKKAQNHDFKVAGLSL